MQVFPCFAFFFIVRILISNGGTWGFGYAFLWVFPVIWLAGIGIDNIIKALFPDKLLANIAGAVVLAIFLFIVFSQ